MQSNIAALIFIGLLSASSTCSLAAEKTTADSTLPPSAMPGLNQAGSAESKEQKADKKGEEAAGSNSGTDSQSTEKDAATSSGSPSKDKKPGQ
ncbi:hypothetical protein [Pseudomonas sp. NFX15]|uniref:hypothetical protein n=1 Tax=Pseudomonas sp. NFX15 TaxID=2816958 RepID=UPI003B8BF7FA